MAMAWYHPLHPSTLRESCLLPPFTGAMVNARMATFELDSRIRQSAWPDGRLWPGITLSITLP